MPGLRRDLRGLTVRLRRDDRGMAVSGVMLIVALAALVLLMALVVPVMQLTANSDQAEDAADAAALAATQRVRELALDAVGGLSTGQTLASALPASAGIDRAAGYADRNGADLVASAYVFRPARGRVDLEVRLRDAGEVVDTARRTEREGAAEVGVLLDRCRLERRSEIIGYEPPPPPPEPTEPPEPPDPTDPEPTPSPTPTPPPEPPPPVPIWGFAYRFVCAAAPGNGGDFTGSWTLDRSAALTAGRSWLDDRLEPRLVR